LLAFISFIFYYIVNIQIIAETTKLFSGYFQLFFEIMLVDCLTEHIPNNGNSTKDDKL
jgi:hypothetical protein